MALIWESDRGAHLAHHGVTITLANEALDDSDAVVITPDYASKSGRGIRTIGYSDSFGGILTVITVLFQGEIYRCHRLRIRSTRPQPIRGGIAMGKRELRELLDEEAAAAEAAREQDQDAPLPNHVKVTRPNRARSKVLQVRLSPEEYEALERLAQSRDIPVSAIARARLLGLLDEPAEGDPLQRLINAARDFALGA